jgi:hypothetical protein
LAAGHDPDMDNRIKWFDYDYCVSVAKFHRECQKMVPICISPPGTRPT